MVELFPRIFVGDLLACSRRITAPGHDVLSQPHVTVHAARNPCHFESLGWTTAQPEHEHYLVHEKGNDLFLNMIDPPEPLFREKLFLDTFAFIDKHIGNFPVVIHCNKGNSRAPTLAMLYAIRTGIFSVESYIDAVIQMRESYSDFKPGRGLQLYVQEKWKELVNGSNVQAQAV